MSYQNPGWGAQPQGQGTAPNGYAPPQPSQVPFHAQPFPQQVPFQAPQQPLPHQDLHSSSSQDSGSERGDHTSSLLTPAQPTQRAQNATNPNTATIPAQIAGGVTLDFTQTRGVFLGLQRNQRSTTEYFELPTEGTLPYTNDGQQQPLGTTQVPIGQKQPIVTVPHQVYQAHGAIPVVSVFQDPQTSLLGTIGAIPAKPPHEDSKRSLAVAHVLVKNYTSLLKNKREELWTPYENSGGITIPIENTADPELNRLLFPFSKDDDDAVMNDNVGGANAAALLSARRNHVYPERDGDEMTNGGDFQGLANIPGGTEANPQTTDFVGEFNYGHAYNVRTVRHFFPPFDPISLKLVTAGNERQELFMLAKHAEGAGRYDDMALMTRHLALLTRGNFSKEERNLFIIAHKRLLTPLRQTLRCFKQQYTHTLQQYLSDVYASHVFYELKTLCKSIIEFTLSIILRSTLINVENHVSFLKLIGDCYRYIAEVSPNDDYDTCRLARSYYHDAALLAERYLSITSPVRLGLLLNYGVAAFELFRDYKTACEMLKCAFSKAVSRMNELSLEDYQDSALLLQLIRDNLVLWLTIYRYNHRIVQYREHAPSKFDPQILGALLDHMNNQAAQQAEQQAKEKSGNTPQNGSQPPTPTAAGGAAGGTGKTIEQQAASLATTLGENPNPADSPTLQSAKLFDSNFNPSRDQLIAEMTEHDKAVAIAHAQNVRGFLFKEDLHTAGGFGKDMEGGASLLSPELLTGQELAGGNTVPIIFPTAYEIQSIASAPSKYPIELPVNNAQSWLLPRIPFSARDANGAVNTALLQQQQLQQQQQRQDGGDQGMHDTQNPH